MRSQPFGKPIYGDWEFGPPELSFSGDCVSLEISGPDVADLSFCDLPGALYHSHRSHENQSIMVPQV
jgi:hypothetical protein